VSRILDHEQAVSVCNLTDSFHVAREATVVENDDGLRSGSHCALEVCHVEVQVI
jgi:hypothetical protein